MKNVYQLEIFIFIDPLYTKKIKPPKRTYGLVTNNEKWVDIDNREDLEILNFYLKDPK